MQSLRRSGSRLGGAGQVADFRSGGGDPTNPGARQVPLRARVQSWRRFPRPLRGADPEEVRLRAFLGGRRGSQNTPIRSRGAQRPGRSILDAWARIPVASRNVFVLLGLRRSSGVSASCPSGVPVDFSVGPLALASAPTLAGGVCDDHWTGRARRGGAAGPVPQAAREAGRGSPYPAPPARWQRWAAAGAALRSRTSSASGSRSRLTKITVHTGTGNRCSRSQSRRITPHTCSSGHRAGRYAPASARSWPAVSRDSTSSSRNPFASARRRIGAFWRGSVMLPEASQPFRRQELTRSLQESALAARSPTGCRPVSQGAASGSRCSRPSPPRVRAARMQTGADPRRPHAHRVQSGLLLAVAAALNVLAQFAFHLDPRAVPAHRHGPHRCPHACASSGTSRMHSRNTSRAAACIRCGSAPSRRLAGTARSPHARRAT